MSSTVVVTGTALYSGGSAAGVSLLALFGPAFVVVAGAALAMSGLVAASRETQEQQRQEADRQKREQYRREKERRRREEKEQRQRQSERERQRQIEEERQHREEEERRQQQLEEERQRQIKEAHQRLVEQTWQQTRQMLRKEIEQVRSAPERQNLVSSLENMASVWRQAMLNNDTPAAEKALAGLRQKIFATRTDEKMLDSKHDDLSRLLTKLGTEAPAGFAPELEALRKDSNSENANLSIEEQAKRIEALKAKACKLAGEIAQANALSLDDLVEQAVFIPEPSNGNKPEEEDAAGVALIADICDFGGRVAFFDEREAEQLKPLVREAKQGTTMRRLELIRSQIKTTYGYLRERAVLTDMFKRDLRDFLPPMHKAQGTEALCQRMEDLLAAPNVSRDAYDEIYMSVKKVFSEQMETITDALLAERVERTLKQMNYTLMDEEGRPVGLKPGEMRLFLTPYEGYRVRVKVGQDGAIATRLVRVVGSEEEKVSVSEYQKQADIEVGKKWCAQLKQFHKALEEEGLPVKDIFRKEPGEELLDIIVDPSVRKQRGQTAAGERPQEILREKSIS